MSAHKSDNTIPNGQADLDTIHEMIQMAYRVAVEPELFSELITTWDRFFENARDDQFAEVLRGHFEQAERIVNDPRLDRTRNLDAILKLVAVPAVLVDESGVLVSGNEAGLNIVGQALGTSIKDVFDNDWHPSNAPETHFFRTEIDGSPLMAASTFVPVSQDGTNVILVRLEASEWSDRLSEALSDTYNLTPTEIETARLLHQGHALARIAEIRGRSAETVRSQLKSVLVKTGLKRQTALLQLLSRLQYVVGSQQLSKTSISVVGNDAGCQRNEVVTLDGRRLVYSTYGATGGRQVLYLTTSSRPEEIYEWRAAVAQHNLHVIAPHRPGFGGSDPTKNRSPDLVTLTNDCMQCLPMSTRAPIVVAGHREGGILAAQIAHRMQSSRNIAATCLISTGVPQVDFDDSDENEGNMQRSVEAVRVFPHALRLGYRAAKRVFEMGPRGQREIVAYFVKSSPTDKALIRSSKFWNIVRENIDYCFERPDTIVDDIKLWSSNWMTDLHWQNTSAPTLHFILGAEHDFLKPERVLDYCADRPTASATIVENTAQLMMYQRPELVAAQLARLF